MAKPSAVLRRHDSTTRETTSYRDEPLQGDWAPSPDAIAIRGPDHSLDDVIAMFDDYELAARRREIDRIEAAWREEFSAGLLTPVAYYRRLRRIRLDILASRADIGQFEIDLFEDGDSEPTTEQAARLGLILGVQPSQLRNSHEPSAFKVLHLHDK